MTDISGRVNELQIHVYRSADGEAVLGPLINAGGGKRVRCKTSLSSMFEAVGAYAAGKITEEKLKEYECKTCPTCGSCSGMYTANSMNCLTEALGMGLRELLAPEDIPSDCRCKEK